MFSHLPRALAHRGSTVPDTDPQPRAHSPPQISHSAMVSDYEWCQTLPHISGVTHELCRQCALLCSVTPTSGHCLQVPVQPPLTRGCKFHPLFSLHLHLVSLKGHWEHCYQPESWLDEISPERIKAVAWTQSCKEKALGSRWFCKRLILTDSVLWESITGVTQFGLLAPPHTPVMHSKFQAYGS